MPRPVFVRPFALVSQEAEPLPRPPAVRSTYLTVPLAVATLVAGCGGDSPTAAVDRVADVQISAATTSVPLGDTLRLAAVARTADARVLPDAPLRWSSANLAVAAVDSLTGLVSAVDTGTVDVRVAVARSDVGASVRLTIVRMPRAIAILFEKDSARIQEPVRLRVVLYDGRHEVMPGVPYEFETEGVGMTWYGGPDGLLVASIGERPIRVRASAGSLVSAWVTLPVRLTPVVWPGLTSVTVGNAHACGLTTSGATYCWGSNKFTQLGNVPGEYYYGAQVRSAPAFTSLEAGGVSTCGLTAAGVAYCWGGNASGELGPGVAAGTASAWIPTAVPAPVAFTALAANGVGSFCALGTDSLAYCWGRNSLHQLGRAPASDADPRVLPVEGSPHFRAITLGATRSCGLLAGGELACWGGSTDPASRVPAAVAPGSSFSTIDAGSSFACGVRPAGAPLCWGTAPAIFGDGLPHDAPVAVSSARDLVAIQGGQNHACGLTAVGTLECWGSENPAGSLGGVPGGQTLTRNRLGLHLTFTAFDAGGAGTCGVATNGETYCWGPLMLRNY